MNGDRKTFEEMYGSKPQTPAAQAAPNASTKTWPQPNKSALAVLRSNPSPAAQKEFDDMFGPGSAAAYMAANPGRAAKRYNEDRR
jgi:hypothetical protein